jgi:hypothetical protein
MRLRALCCGIVVLVCIGKLHAQGAAGDPEWRSAEGTAVASSSTRGPSTEPTASFPQFDGQVWREYEIRSYTSRVAATRRPQAAIVDWVLLETGYEVWHGDVPSVLSATRDRLSVYHNSEIHGSVASIVDRFVNLDMAMHTVAIRLVSVGHANWRALAQNSLTATEVQSQGVQAWLLSREDASLLLNELRHRADFRELSAPETRVRNGETVTVALTTPRNYVRDLIRDPMGTGVLPQSGQVDDSLAVEVTTLAALDGGSLEAIVQCHVSQVERLIPVLLNAPAAEGGIHRSPIQVPQLAGQRVHERFRWPTQEVLLISFGVIPIPGIDPSLMTQLGIPAPNLPGRGDLLLFLESKGSMDTSPDAVRIGRRTGRAASVR